MGPKVSIACVWTCVQATLYNTARLMGPKVSIACVWTCVQATLYNAATVGLPQRVDHYRQVSLYIHVHTTSPARPSRRYSVKRRVEDNKTWMSSPTNYSSGRRRPSHTLWPPPGIASESHDWLCVCPVIIMLKWFNPQFSIYHTHICLFYSLLCMW